MMFLAMSATLALRDVALRPTRSAAMGQTTVPVTNVLRLEVSMELVLRSPNVIQAYTQDGVISGVRALVVLMNLPARI